MRRFVVLMLGLLLAMPATAQNALKFGTSPSPIPYVTGIVDPGAGQANFNSLIQELNLVLSPVLPTSSTSAVGGTTIVVGPPAGTIGTVGVSIVPTAAGGITLFSQGGTGLLQIASQNSWFPARGLTQCPGTTGGLASAGQNGLTSTNQLLGPGGTVSGFFPVTDWLGRAHYLVTC